MKPKTKQMKLSKQNLLTMLKNLSPGPAMLMSDDCSYNRFVLAEVVTKHDTQFCQIKYSVRAGKYSFSYDALSSDAHARDLHILNIFSLVHTNGLHTKSESLIMYANA